MSNFIRDKPLRRTAAEPYENESDQEFIADSEENYSGSDSDVGSGKLTGMKNPLIIFQNLRMKLNE